MKRDKPMEPDEFCRARTGKGTPCEKEAGWGTDHKGIGRCRLHGGATPNAQVAGAVTLARREAGVMGIPIDIAPHEAILECIRIAAGEVAYCSERISALSLGDAAGPVETSEEVSSGDWTQEKKTMGPPALHIWIKARHVAMDRLVNYSAIALKAGVEERQVQVAERYGESFVAFIRGFLARMGMEDDPRALDAVRAELLIVNSTAVEVT